jgi:signal transduction histidine kinase
MNSEPRRVLVLEDDPFHYEMLRDACGGRVQLERVTQLSDALAAARRQRFDVLLLDLHVPDSTGIVTLEKALQECLDLPVVVLTTIDDEELGSHCVRLGAHDYLVKGREPTLGDGILRAIRHAVERQAARVELDRERERREGLKDEFLSHVSHELRTPLNAVHQFSTILQAGIAGQLSDAQQEYVGIIVRNAKQLAKMIDDILEVARADTQKLRIQPRPCALEKLVHAVQERLGPEIAAKQLGLRVSILAGLPQVYADPDRVEQVLSNLLENAIKFTPAGGAIELRARGEVPDEVRVEICDSGCGVSAENRERIFERMHQDPNSLELSRKGLGLGLYICRELLGRQGGRIWLERSGAEGSTFCFALPSFSLPRLLRAKIVSGDLLRKDLTLILFRLEARARDALDDRTRAALREVIERGIYPDRDLLLPVPTGEDAEDAFFVLASTDRAGATALCARLRAAVRMSDELAELEELLEIAQTEVDVSYERAIPLDPAIAQLAVRVAALQRQALRVK